MQVSSSMSEVRIHTGNPWSSKPEDVLVVELDNDGDSEAIVIRQEDVDGGRPSIHLSLQHAMALSEVLNAMAVPRARELMISQARTLLPPVVSQEVLK